jgi:hypothetical protein
MKKLIALFGFLIFFTASDLFSQATDYISDDFLLKESFDFSVGVNTGFFDSNQHPTYPLNFGIVAQYNYIPDVSKNWFFGAELGAFYTQIEEKPEKWGRSLRAAFADITIYPGLSFPINPKHSDNDNAATRLRKINDAKKFRVGLGFTVAIPLMVKSEGIGANPDQVKTGIGFSLRTSYDFTNRLTLFANGTRIGRDMDGFGYISNDSGIPLEGNEHKATYYYKVGVLWHFLEK